jgi:aminoglycoside phosphotransferase
MDNSQNNGASAPLAEEQVQRVEEAAVGSNPVEGNPSACNMAPQAQTQTAQNTVQGDAATPLETGVRQRGDAEKQRAAEAKAAREAALANLNKERRQKRLRSAQELNQCLGSGMDLLTLEQVGQITEAAAAAGSEPRDALRSFGERLRDLREENPHASEADLREAVKGAVQALIARSREQRQKVGTQRVAAESDTPRDGGVHSHGAASG